MYNDLVLPAQLMGVHYKSAIAKRNKWMVEKSGYIIDCTYRDFGGAYNAVVYGKSLCKTVLKIKKQCPLF